MDDAHKSSIVLYLSSTEKGNTTINTYVVFSKDYIKYMTDDMLNQIAEAIDKKDQSKTATITQKINDNNKKQIQYRAWSMSAESINSIITCVLSALIGTKQVIITSTDRPQTIQILCKEFIVLNTNIIDSMKDNNQLLRSIIEIAQSKSQDNTVSYIQQSSNKKTYYIWSAKNDTITRLISLINQNNASKLEMVKLQTQALVHQHGGSIKLQHTPLFKSLTKIFLNTETKYAYLNADIIKYMEYGQLLEIIKQIKAQANEHSQSNLQSELQNKQYDVSSNIITKIQNISKNTHDNK